MFILLLRKERSGDLAKVTKQATCRRVYLGRRSLGSPAAGPWRPGGTDRPGQRWLGLGVCPQVSVARSASQGRVDHPLEREGGIINNNANKREKTKPVGPEHFLNKEISLISWLI